jgi:hypothetical protein
MLMQFQMQMRVESMRGAPGPDMQIAGYLAIRAHSERRGNFHL